MSSVVGFFIDLADIESVNTFAKTVVGERSQIDAVILNADVMMCPPSVAKQGQGMKCKRRHGTFEATRQDLLGQSSFAFKGLRHCMVPA